MVVLWQAVPQGLTQHSHPCEIPAHMDPGPGSVTCCGQWAISKHDANCAFMSACTLGACPLAPSPLGTELCFQDIQAILLERMVMWRRSGG